MASDLISRQQAIDGLSGHYIERINLNDWQAGWNAALDWVGGTYLDELPSAQPEPCEDAVSRKLMYELGATCMARRDENGELVALGRLDMLPSVQPEPTTEIQDILDYLDTALHPIISPEHWNVYSELHDMISTLPSAQPEVIRCKDCKHIDEDGVYQNSKGLAIQDDDDYCSYAERKE